MTSEGVLTRFALSLALAALVISGCSGAEQPEAPEPFGSTTTPRPEPTGESAGDGPQVEPLPAHDPPRGFRGTFTTSVLAHRVVGDVLYTVTSDWEIETWEMATGEQLGTDTLSLPSDFPGRSRTPPVAFTEIDDRPAVVVVYEYEVRGAGTAPDQERFRIQAHYADDGFRVWATDVESLLANAISATNSDFTLVSGMKSDLLVTYVFETSTGELRHEWEPFTAHAIEGSIVVGWFDTGRLTGGISSPSIIGLEGRDARTGEVAWSREVPGRGSGYLLGDGLMFHTSAGSEVFRAATGEVVLNIVDDVGKEYQGNRVADLYCAYDGAGLLVCGQRGGGFLAAWDLDRKERLWIGHEIGQGRVLSSNFSAVRHGALYMFPARDRSPLVLDARTGDELVPSIVEVVHEVGPGYGIHVSLHNDARPAPQGTGERYSLKAFRSTS